MEAHLYNVEINWKADRKGVMCSKELMEEGGHCLEVATPPEFPKGIPGIWSPEHLFTAAVGSCLMTTFLAIADNSKLAYKDFQCKTTGKLEQVEGKYMMSEIILDATVIIYEEKDREKAERILHKSEAACLISNSVKSKIVLKPTIIKEDLI